VRDISPDKTLSGSFQKSRFIVQGVFLTQAANAFMNFARSSHVASFYALINFDLNPLSLGITTVPPSEAYW